MKSAGHILVNIYHAVRLLQTWPVKNLRTSGNLNDSYITTVCCGSERPGDVALASDVRAVADGDSGQLVQVQYKVST